MAETLILEKFTADPELSRLEEMLTEFDLFTFLDLSTSEEVHSRTLPGYWIQKETTPWAISF